MEEAKKKKHDSGEEKREAVDKPKAKRLKVKSWLLPLAGIVLAVLLAAAGYVYTITPESVRKPKMDHLHFRMQVVVDGQDVDFSKSPFQTPYAKGQCSADLSDKPFHFHDGKDQFVHVHWAGMTGGLLLKNYGWSFVGGNPNVLGYRLDDLPRIKAVPIHGDALPAVPEGAGFWVYTGDGNGYQKKSFDDFKTQGLEQFFGKDSNFPKASQNGGIVSWLFPKASAHGGELHEEVLTVGGESEEERLTRINNLIGNVVIFVQPGEPSDEQIKARFSHLEPLSDSTCGG